MVATVSLGTIAVLTLSALTWWERDLFHYRVAVAYAQKNIRSATLMWTVALETFARMIQVLANFAYLIIHRPNARRRVLAAGMITSVVGVRKRYAGERRTTGIHDCA